MTLLIVLALALAACGRPVISPVVGTASPQASPTPVGASTATPAASAQSATPATPQPTPTKPTVQQPTTPSPASFKTAFAYGDGVSVAVTKIDRTTLGGDQRASRVKKGAAIQILSIRVTNKTSVPLSAAAATTAMTYGPHSKLASTVKGDGIKPIVKPILPGKSRTGTFGFAVPKKYLNQATLKFRPDVTHQPALFVGSVEYSPGNGSIFNDPTGSQEAQMRITRHVERSIKAAAKGSTIRIAHYGFDIQSSAAALIAAHKRGVRVQMIVDKHGPRDEPGNDYVTRQTRNLTRELGKNRKKKSFVVQCNASCMSNHTSAMHAKFYLFSSVGSSKMVSMISSANLTHTNSGGSWNDIQTVVGDAAIYNSLAQYFKDMAPDKNRPNYYRTTQSGPYGLYLFPRASEKRVVLLGVLEHVTCTGAAPGYGNKDGHTVIRVTMYSWQGKRIDLAKKLWSLQNKGCQVQIVLNSGRTSYAVKNTLSKSTKHGRIQIHDAWIDRNNNDTAERYMHEKAMAINGVWSGRPNTKVVYSGSQNFTSNATLDNNDLIFRHADDKTYDAYAENFKYIRSHTRRLW